mgnify:CR=1 FL=1
MPVEVKGRKVVVASRLIAAGQLVEAARLLVGREVVGVEVNRERVCR